MDEQQKKLEQLDRVLTLTRTQRDRARRDLEIFANEYAQLVRHIKRLPRWLLRMYRIPLVSLRK